MFVVAVAVAVAIAAAAAAAADDDDDQGRIWAQIIGAASQNQCPNECCVPMIFLSPM